MVQAPWLAPHLPLSRAHGIDERSRLLGTEGAEAQPLREAPPAIAFSLIPQSALRHGAELLDRPAAAGGAEDAVVGGHEPRLLEVKQPGQELAAGKVSKRTEQDDDVGIWDHGVAGVHRVSMAAGVRRQRRSRSSAGCDRVLTPALDVDIGGAARRGRTRCGDRMRARGFGWLTHQ
jgi:hypothetical protein